MKKVLLILFLILAAIAYASPPPALVIHLSKTFSDANPTKRAQFAVKLWQNSSEPGWLACTNTAERRAWADNGWEEMVKLSNTNVVGYRYNVTMEQTKNIASSKWDEWRQWLVDEGITTNGTKPDLLIDKNVQNVTALSTSYGVKVKQ